MVSNFNVLRVKTLDENGMSLGDIGELCETSIGKGSGGLFIYP